MSVANPPMGDSPAEARAGAPPAALDAACPLCGSPLDADQEWCLRCGAAARTRLAAPSNWKAPILALALIITLALGALTAALVKLTASNTQTVPPPITRTITSVPPAGSSAIAPTPTTATPTPTGAAPGAVPVPKTPGAVNPGTPTTLQPSNPTSTAGAPPAANSPAATTPAKTTGGTTKSTEEALRKAGFSPRSGR